MKVSVQISRGIESLFGTHDENIRVLEDTLNVSTQLREDSLELEGAERMSRAPRPSWRNTYPWFRKGMSSITGT